MTTPPSAHKLGTNALMRSGTSARLAGISLSTPRIWEHRYGVAARLKPAAGQRTYSMRDDPRRLKSSPT